MRCTDANKVSLSFKLWAILIQQFCKLWIHGRNMLLLTLIGWNLDIQGQGMIQWHYVCRQGTRLSHVHRHYTLGIRHLWHRQLFCFSSAAMVAMWWAVCSHLLSAHLILRLLIDLPIVILKVDQVALHERKGNQCVPDCVAIHAPRNQQYHACFESFHIRNCFLVVQKLTNSEHVSDQVSDRKGEKHLPWEQSQGTQVDQAPQRESWAWSSPRSWAPQWCQTSKPRSPSAYRDRVPTRKTDIKISKFPIRVALIWMWTLAWPRAKSNRRKALMPWPYLGAVVEDPSNGKQKRDKVSVTLIKTSWWLASCHRNLS